MKTSFHSLAFAFARQVVAALALAATALADNHPPVANTDAVTATEGRTLDLAAVRLLLNDTDADGDALAVMDAGPGSAQGGQVLFFNNVVRYTPPAGYVGPDSFSYTIRDGQGGMASAQVNVLVASANLPSQNLVGIVATPGGLSVRFAGVFGRSYLIQRAPAVTGPWTTLATRTAPASSIFEFLDSDPPPGVFYRAILP